MLDERAVTRRTPVPFLDLRPSHDSLKQAILEDLASLIDMNAFSNGPHVGRFEEQFARYCGTRDCIGLASGLDALRLVLIGLDIGPGDEVLVPAQTFVATWEAVSQAGALPVPVEIGEDDYCIDAVAAAAATTSRTRAVMPVHLFGQMADMSSLTRLAERHGLALVEDACQAHGATRDGQRAGTAGSAAGFSFYPGKNLGAFGDAGALVTDDAELAVRVRALREHGQRAKYSHEAIGYTARLDTVQALVLLHKLEKLERWNEQRRAAAVFYHESLACLGDLRLPIEPAGSEAVWHLYVVRTARRDELVTFLRVRGIGVGLHYPEPPHLSVAYAHLGFGPGAFPVAEALAGEALSLPLFPGITETQLETVADAVSEFFRHGR
jgi:dTDP-4-amino-4,6-dideoxygalactose transaminase